MAISPEAAGKVGKNDVADAFAAILCIVYTCISF
jgi:hypothetical protein